MLKDELDQLQQWAASGLKMTPEAAVGAVCAVNAECERVRAAFKKAIFSASTNECLKRYFHYHLLELTDILDRLESSPQGDQCLCMSVLALLDDLWQSYSAYLDADVVAPILYQKRFIACGTAVAERLSSAVLAAKLKTCLSGFIQEMSVAKAGRCFHELQYFRNWLARLGELSYDHARTEADLHLALEALNYNELSYFNLRLDGYRHLALPADEKLRYLSAEKVRLMATVPENQLSCRSGWPSIAQMLGGWLAEEAMLLEKEWQKPPSIVPVNRPEKFPLNLSVAHLGCLLKLLCSGEVAGEHNLTRLFQFVTGHFSTKRQKDISARSLSKEYYSTSQVTAANVRGLLQDMLTEINRKYFPLVAGLATGAALGLLPGT